MKLNWHAYVYLSPTLQHVSYSCTLICLARWVFSEETAPLPGWEWSTVTEDLSNFVFIPFLNDRFKLRKEFFSFIIDLHDIRGYLSNMQTFQSFILCQNPTSMCLNLWENIKKLVWGLLKLLLTHPVSLFSLVCTVF